MVLVLVRDWCTLDLVESTILGNMGDDKRPDETAEETSADPLTRDGDSTLDGGVLGECRLAVVVLRGFVLVLPDCVLIGCVLLDCQLDECMLYKEDVVDKRALDECMFNEGILDKSVLDVCLFKEARSVEPLLENGPLVND